METIIKILIGAASFYVGAMVLKGVEIKSFVQAIIVAIVVASLDSTLGTVLKVLTLGIFSLGILSWLLNAILITIADWFLPGFKVKNFWWAHGLAAIVSIVGGVLTTIF